MTSSSDFCATRNATLSVAHNETGSIQNRGGKVTCSFRNEPNLARFSGRNHRERRPGQRTVSKPEVSA